MTAISHDGPRGHGESCSPECQACAAMRPPERKPAAGWAMRSRALWLKAAGYLAQVQTDGKKPGRWSLWLVSPNAGGGWTEVRGDDAPSVEAAQLAAEDALRAIAAEILRAVPR